MREEEKRSLSKLFDPDQKLALRLLLAAMGAHRQFISSQQCFGALDNRREQANLCHLRMQCDATNLV
jgi:hypothetical protein